MEKKTMGAFLAALRKAHGYTQQEVADKLNISNKTVSKWERDEGCPEIMMLPAIAELYDVTVDEILRGERIIKAENEQLNEEKTEKRAKYLFDKALSRFTNLSFISIALGVLASILAYLTCILSNTYATQTICVLLTLLMTCASLIIQVVAFNNFKTNFNTEDNIIDERTTGKTKKKALIYLCITICLVIIAVIGITTDIIGLFDPYPFIPVNIFVSGAIAFAIYRIMYKNIGADKDDEAVLSPEFLAYRKKHIKNTSVFIAVIIVVCMVFPFVAELVDSLTASYGFTFPDAIIYGQYTLEDAENDYNKLKDFFLNGEQLYIIEYDMSPVLSVYELTANCTDAKFDDEGQIVSGDYEIVTEVCETKIFNTVDEAEAFRYNECWDNDILSIYEINSKVSFDDETLTVNYAVPADFTLPFDILSLFMLIASCIAIVTAVISFIIYINKRKKSTGV
ncbi:MAG: helix-turn-helix transcriptional regulator [Clostridia bacterium]|nr:helix-turn-helix transcriptional regulator [Clostridia bacterium]